MSFPLINPYQQFYDSSGAPLASGTIEFRDPNTDSLINTYPTADYADAQTNANANPLTLSATGAAATGLYLEDGVKYKIILKDSDGNIVTTQDDVQCPEEITAANIGAALYPQTTAETNAAVTISDYSYPPGDIRRYGAATGTADNTTAIQDAINASAYGGYAVFIPGAVGGRYRFASTLYGFYDATNNPNFPSGSDQDGRLLIKGELAPNKSGFVANEYRGSILEYTTATGVGLDLYDDSGTEAKAVVLRDFGVYANTSGYPVQMDRIPQLSIVENVFIGNDGSGGGLKIDTWASALRDVWLYGNGSGSGVALDTSDGGGNVTWSNVNAENFNVGFDFGSAYNAARASVDYIWNHMLQACQAKSNAIGFQIRHGVGAITLFDCWTESNTSRGIAISDMAGFADGAAPPTNHGIIKIIGGYLGETAGAGFMSVEIGDDSGTTTTDAVGPVLIDGLVIGQIATGSYGIRIHNDSNAQYRTIRNLVGHNNGGYLCVIDDEAQVGTIYAEKWDTGTYNENSRIDNTGGSDRSYYAVTDWSPLLNGTATFDYSTAAVMPSVTCSQSGGDITIKLPDSDGGNQGPIEHSCVITVGTANANQVVLDPGVTLTINGSTTDITFDGKYAKILLSYDRDQKWTASIAAQPNVGTYTPTNVSTDRAFDADTVAVAELADVVGTLIADLQTQGLIN